MQACGKKTWLIPDTYLHSVSSSDRIEDRSHEAICVLNTSDTDAHIALTLYFEDREPDTTYTSFCAARRTHHIRLDKLVNDAGTPIQRDTPYAILVSSDTPIVVQYSRLDTSAVQMALMTTVAYAVEDGEQLQWS